MDQPNMATSVLLRKQHVQWRCYSGIFLLQGGISFSFLKTVHITKKQWCFTGISSHKMQCPNYNCSLNIQEHMEGEVGVGRALKGWGG